MVIIMTLDEFESQCNDMSQVEFDSTLLNFQMAIMDLILDKKFKEGKIVFSEVEDGLLN